MTDLELSDGVDLEQDLNEDYLLRLCSLGKAQKFQRGQYLYYQGDAAGHVYVLRAGMIKATCTDENGHETLLKIHNPGSLLGLSALRPRAVRDANAVSLQGADTVSFGREEFFEYMRSDGELGVLLVRVLLKRQQQLHSRVSEVASHRVDQRVARVLLQLSAEAGTRLADGARASMPITHEELATLVLSRRQYVTSILRTFVCGGLIENRRRNIRVVDADGLRQIASGAHLSPNRP